MKLMHSALVLFAICLCNSLFAQTPVKINEVPQAVLKNYYIQNSKGAKDSAWSKEMVTIYKVNYIDDGKNFEAQYFASGDWIKTITEIPATEVPLVVSNQLKDLYPNYTIAKSYIELNNDGKFYTLDLVRGKDKITIYFLMSGKFVK